MCVFSSPLACYKLASISVHAMAAYGLMCQNRKGNFFFNKVCSGYFRDKLYVCVCLSLCTVLNITHFKIKGQSLVHITPLFLFFHLKKKVQDA